MPRSGDVTLDYKDVRARAVEWLRAHWDPDHTVAGWWRVLAESADDDTDGRATIRQRALSSPGISIAGGTDEIQRDIIGERVLGLPKEPRVDRDAPFRDLKTGNDARKGPTPRSDARAGTREGQEE